jgi:hypothetical protein
VLRALAGRDLPSHFDPSRKIVVPGNLSLTPLHLTGTDFGCALSSDQHAPGRGRGFGEAGKDLDPQATTGQGLNSIETSLIEIHGCTTAIDPDWFVGQSKFGDLEDDRTVCKEDHGAFGLCIAAEGNGIETQGRVFVKPHQVGVRENDLHPRFTGRIDPVAPHQRHIDDRFQAFLLAYWLNGRIAFEV